MYIASTRFKIIPGQEKKFEALWRQRESNLEFVDGFEKFNLLMGFKTGGFSMYASNTKWESKKSFDALDSKQQKALMKAGKVAEKYMTKEAAGLDTTMEKAYKEAGVKLSYMKKSDFDFWTI